MMKTKIILAALLLMVSSGMRADKYNYLTLTYSGTDQSISLPLVQRITFEDGAMVVSTTQGKYTYSLSNLDKITFTEIADAIKALPEQAENLTYKDGTLAIKGDGMLYIYNAGGALVSIANVKEGANVNLGNLPAGVYVVRMGNKTIKVRK